MRMRPLAAALCCGLCVSLAVSGCTVKRYWGASSTGGGGQQAKIGLVTKTDSNPYFVAMRAAAQAEATKRGAQLTSLAGKFDGDNEGQVTAIENLIQQGVNTILITPSTGTGVIGAIAKARQRGIMVLALDSTTDPESAADATFATDNADAGRKQGAYLRAALGGRPSKVIMIDGTAGSTVNTQRRGGFFRGFGIPSDSAPDVLGHQTTNGDQNNAQQVTENLLQRDASVSVVYNMNEANARGSYAALVDKGLAGKAVFGTIDGGCGGVDAVAAGKYNVDVMQFPAKMAALGVDAGVTFAKTGQKPTGFHDTGSEAIARTPVPGVATKDPAWGRQHCWSDK